MKSHQSLVNNELGKVSNLAKMINNSIAQFNKKYFEVSNMLNEMRFDFVSQMREVIECISEKKTPLSSFASPIKVNSRLTTYTKSNFSSVTSVLQTEANESCSQSSTKTLKKVDNTTNKNLMKSFKQTISRNHSMSNPKDKTYSSFNTKKKKSILKKSNEKKRKNVMRAIKICADNAVVPFNEKVKLKYMNKESYKEINMKDICKRTKEVIKERMNIINNKGSIKKYPTKTAQVNLFFLNKEKEDSILNDNTQNAKNIIEIIYSILDEQFDTSKDNIDLYKALFRKYQVADIRSLFLQVIYTIVYYKQSFNRANLNKILYLYSSNEDYLLSISRGHKSPLCWISFSLLEIYEYLTINVYSNVEYKELLTISDMIDSIIKKLQ